MSETVQPWHEELVNFLCNPFDNRSYEEFAKSLGLTYQTIYRYRKSHEAEIAAEVERRKEAMFGAMRSVAYKSLASKLKTDTTALKLFFQLSGDLIERSEVAEKPLTRDQKLEKLSVLFADLQQKGVLPSSLKAPATLQHEKKELNKDLLLSQDRKDGPLTGQVPTPPTSI